jgi:hypothetical protein
MKKLAFAALAAMSAGACATTGNDNGSVTARPAVAGAQYCWQERLAAIGTRMNCNWAKTLDEACTGNAAFSTIDATPYAGPHKATQCANGRWIVQLTPKN